MLDDLVPLPQAASELGLQWYTTRRLALRGALGPLQRIAGRLLLTRAGIDVFKSTQRANPPTDSSSLGSDAGTGAAS